MAAICCEQCHKPKVIPTEDFSRWFMAKRSEPFVPLRQFLADYCTCETEATDG